MTLWLCPRGQKFVHYFQKEKKRLAGIFKMAEVKIPSKPGFFGTWSATTRWCHLERGTRTAISNLCSTVRGWLEGFNCGCMWCFASFTSELSGTDEGESFGDVSDGRNETVSIGVVTVTSGILHFVPAILWLMRAKVAIFCFSSVLLTVSFMCISASDNSVVIFCNSRKIALVFQIEL